MRTSLDLPRSRPRAVSPPSPRGARVAAAATAPDARVSAVDTSV